MSSLLEQAIVDATALKEAALKNAESSVLEKYSTEVKSALDTLLEQEGSDASFIEDIPMAHENEEIEGLDEDEMVEIDFDDIKARLDAEEDEGIEAEPSEMLDSEETAQDIFGDESVLPAAPPEMEAAPVDMEAPVPLAEELAISEEMVKEILEELTVDVSPELGGWASMAAADTQPHVEEMEAVAAAAEAQSPEVTDEKEKYLELYEAKVSSLEEEAASMRSLLGEARAQLNFLILENAKLLYQNKALNSASLNERQKEKIVDAVRNATTVEEAKMLFETLQSAVGGHKTRRTNSLREAVSRPSASMLLSSKREAASTAVDPNLDRMLRLAGLRKQ